MLLRIYDTLTKEFQCTSPISEFVKANELTKEEIDTIHDLKLNETFQIGTFTVKAIHEDSDDVVNHVLDEVLDLIEQEFHNIDTLEGFMNHVDILHHYEEEWTESREYLLPIYSQIYQKAEKMGFDKFLAKHRPSKPEYNFMKEIQKI